jgi:outer membrane protein OmpA-like peptidoglycan-associated protein
MECIASTLAPLLLSLGLAAGCDVTPPGQDPLRTLARTSVPAAADGEAGALPDHAASALLEIVDVYFEFGGDEIRPREARLLDIAAEILKVRPRVRVLIEGHADERATSEYNQALGERRAHSTRNYLLARGVPPEQLGAVSYGSLRPLCDARDDSCRARNRRAHLVVTPAPSEP